jgi:uncharacterized membrane protein YgdD (TMEM256/DUF423 family)
MYRPAILMGSFFAALAVILGAFGAHALKEVLTPEQLTTFETGVRYQFYHSFALLAAGIIYSSFPFKQVRLAAIFFMIGIMMFSGSLYLLTWLKMREVVGLRGIGIITPIGGVFFILGWLMMIFGMLKRK